MKKKVAALIVTLSMAATLFVSGCNIQVVDDVDASTNSNTNTSESIKDNESLVLVEEGEPYSGYQIYADKETGVMYLWMWNNNKGGLTVMLNEDGSPKIWDGFTETND